MGGVCAIVAAAGVAQGLSGFGFSLVSIPLLALVVPVKAAIVGGAVLGLVQSGLVVARDHRHVEWRSAGILIVAAIAGMPIGLFVITRVRRSRSRSRSRLVLVFAVLLWRRARLPTDSLPAEIGVGLTSGMLSTGTGMSGPPLGILLGELAFRRVDHERFRATVLVLLVASAVLALVGALT